MNPVFEGILLGVSLSFLLGPVFFALLNTSLHKGFLSGAFMAIGISLSDATAILLSFMGLTSLISVHKYQLILGVIGGAVMIIFGTITFNKKVRFKEIRPRSTPIKNDRKIMEILKGFFLNITNPFVWLFWLSVVTVVHSNYDNRFKTTVFFLSALATVISFDLLKAYLAHKFKRLTRPKVMFWINKIAGAIIVVFGIVLIIRVSLHHH